MCLITDRHRAGGEAAQVARVAAAARAGVHLVQVRERDLDGGALLDFVRECLDAVHATRTRVLVNDRLDVALAAGAHGVHLRSDSLAAPRARAITPPGFLVGRSVHTREEAEAVAAGGGLDYLMFGTVFPTGSKSGRTAAGAQVLADVVRATTLPVLAVGGVTAETASEAGRAGAAGFAAIGMFTLADDDGLKRAIASAAQAFDTRESVR
jgi:thiamine-phosphate pyrophosphorylase